MQGTRGTSLSDDENQPDTAEPVDAESAGSVLPAAAAEPGDASGAAARRIPVVFWLVALAAVAADQLSKALVLRELQPGKPVDLLGSVLRLHLVKNPGAAFSLGTGYTLILTAVATTVVVAVLVLSRKLRSTLWMVALGLMLGGALGNLGDRYLREPGPFRGHVIDFLELPYWPVFNIADMCVVSAAVLMVLQTMRGIGLDGTREDRG